MALHLSALDALAFGAGGVGAALGEMLPRHTKPGALILPVSIVGGSGEHHHTGRISVGKRRLVAAIATAARAGRLQIGLPPEKWSSLRYGF